MKDDVIAMYKKGLSIDYIVNSVFRRRLRNTSSVIKVGNTVIVSGEKPKKVDTRKEIEGILLENKI